MNPENFFDPKSVAVIGATADKNKVGYSLVFNLLAGKARKIFPVTLSEKEILGLPAFVSISDIPDKIDLAIIAVRNVSVPQILSDCAEKKIGSVIVISSGFKEMGEEGEKLEDDIKKIARENNIALLGPNCLGVIDTQTDLNASFAGQKPPPGQIAFLSQSGALGTAMIDWAIGEGVGFSKFISLGNEAGLSEIDFLKYLKDDDATKSIIMYLENLSDGPEFIKIVSEITKKKPVVVIKAGMGGHGNMAVKSHTGSLAPEASVFIAACKQAGAVTVSSIRGFFNLTKPLSQGLSVNSPVQRLIILTNAGGPSVIATDFVGKSKSLSLIPLGEETKNALRNVLPPMAAVGNPVDIIGDALSDRYDKALQILCEVKEADGIIVILTPQMMTDSIGTAKVLAKYKNRKKIFPIFIGGPEVHKGREELSKFGMVGFTFPRDVVDSLDHLANNKPKFQKENHSDSEQKIFSETGMMNFENMSGLLAEYDILLSGIFVKDKFDIVPLLKKIKSQSFAAKIISGDLVHKTENGAVALNLQTADEAEKFWDSVRKKNPAAKIEGMLIQPMTAGREVIIGMKRDATFGPTILFGLGGILAEAIKDTNLRVAPIEKIEAMKMMQEIKGIKILQGLRGKPPVDFDSLADILVAISHLATDHPEIKEIDLNPVMATESGATVVDARIMV
jgi:acetyltransferase